MKRLQKNKKSGSVLIIVIGLLAILLVLGIGYLSLGSQSRSFAARDAWATVARSAADAGVTRALYALDGILMNYQYGNSVTWAVPTPSSPLSLENTNATYTYSVDTSNLLTSFYATITATGTAGPATKTIIAKVTPQNPAEDAGLRVTTLIGLGHGSAGYYDDVPPGSAPPMIIRTDSTTKNDVTVGSLYSKTTVITGYSPTPYDPTQVVNVNNPNGDLTGISAAPAPDSLPPVSLPIGVTFIPMGSITGPGTVGTAGVTAYYQYDSINLSTTKGDLTIYGNVTMYVTGDIDLTKQGATMTISTGSSLTLYLGGNIDCEKEGITLNGTLDSSRLEIYGLSPGTYDGYTVPGCTSIQFQNGGTITAYVYAPVADVSFKNSGTFNGALAANSLDFGNGSSPTFNFDQGLRYKLNGFTGSKRFLVRRWQESGSWTY